MQQRLALTDYLFILLFILLLTFGASYGLQRWLLNVQSETTQRIEHSGRIYQ